MKEQNQELNQEKNELQEYKFGYPIIKPTNPKDRDRYVDENDHLWNYWRGKWSDKGDCEKYLIAEKKWFEQLAIKKQKKEEARKKKELKNSITLAKQNDTIINNQENNTIINNQENNISEEDQLVKNIIIQQEKKEFTEKMRQTLQPNPDLVQGNKFYFVVDITSPDTGNKISFNFVNYLSSYFVGATIYVIGLDNGYTKDHFMKIKPNVIFFKPTSKKILNSYIAYSRRFYTFSQSYAKWAIEQNINACTLFIQKGNISIYMDKLDICEVDGDVVLDTISLNQKIILSY